MGFTRKDVREPSLLQALIPIVFLLTLLAINVNIFDDTIAGSNQIALLLTGGIAGLIAIFNGQKWEYIQHNILKTLHSAMPSMLILFLIGSLAGTWMISGVVPAMIYYGLDVINPKFFLISSVVVSAIVSIATGSSWSTIATIGVALLGIGQALGFSDAVTAGAIISGAYFGDKMSPLSDTTNLAPAMAGTDLFTHIRYMVYTTVPSIVITLIIFLILGFTIDVHGTADVTSVKSAIESTFTITPVLFLVPICLLAIIVLKMPALPALLIGTLLGGIAAIIYQPHIINGISGVSNDYLLSSYKGVMQAMLGDVSIKTDNPMVSDLLNTSGMGGMLSTVWLIISAMVFAGVMEGGKFLQRITQSIIRFANSTTSLVASTVGTGIFFNFTASDQYLAIVVAGRMFNKTYKDKKIAPEVLSRALEDSGTVTSVLIPWNTCGAAQAKVLGVATLTYLPYCFFNIISPLMSIFVAMIGYKIRYIKDNDNKELESELD
ncbi:Na+/H+ antiporter NhaC [Halosquirtibacter laminarini]|uniref:Na+/H+ antiporter NhaC n=1 Tax=Halosquirtibacter laminarini TaxID=3374600 RepID=A0AC61NL41_9BACT|nr:Na+/H+ antiporter NhaC [Prolixibacteraceae bacterium]